MNLQSAIAQARTPSINPGQYIAHEVFLALGMNVNNRVARESVRFVTKPTREAIRYHVIKVLYHVEAGHEP